MTDLLQFERFDKTQHRRDLFDCGNPSLNDFLKKNLNQQEKEVSADYMDGKYVIDLKDSFSASWILLR